MGLKSNRVRRTPGLRPLGGEVGANMLNLKGVVTEVSGGELDFRHIRVRRTPGLRPLGGQVAANMLSFRGVVIETARR